MQVDLDLSIPFISIPLNADEDGDGTKPLVNVNLKSVTLAAILAGLATFIVPLLMKSPAANRYRGLFFLHQTHITALKCHFCMH